MRSQLVFWLSEWEGVKVLCLHRLYRFEKALYNCWCWWQWPLNEYMLWFCKAGEPLRTHPLPRRMVDCGCVCHRSAKHVPYFTLKRPFYTLWWTNQLGLARPSSAKQKSRHRNRKWRVSSNSSVKSRCSLPSSISPKVRNKFPLHLSPSPTLARGESECWTIAHTLSRRYLQLLQCFPWC